MKKYSLGVLQSYPTQFDGPLYRFLSSHPDIELQVYYSRPGARANTYDLELGRETGWDNGVTEGYPVTICGRGFGGRVRFVRKITSSRHDLLIFCGYFPYFHLALSVLARIFGICTGLRSDNVFLYRKGSTLKWRLKDILCPLIFRLYKTGHPVGSLAKAYFMEYGFGEDRLFLFPYSVDHEFLVSIAQNEAQTSELRRKLGLKREDFVILGVMKFVPREDPLTLFQSFAKVVHRHEKAHLVVVGDGELRGQIEEFIRSHNLKRVHLPGYASYTQLGAYYGIANVFVHPAKHESWGVSVNEAMACGVPVIVADTVGAGYDLVEPGKAGFVFRAGIPEELADCIIRLATSRETPGFSSQVENRIHQWSFQQTARHLLTALEFVSR